jgi:DNA-binding MarR family transcriptional regulator
MLVRIDREGPVRAVDIADMFGFAPRTVTEALDALERDGLVRRDPDPHDRRVKCVSISSPDRQAIAATEPLRLQLVERIFGTLDQEERAQLYRIVGKLSAAVAGKEDG